MEKLSEQVKVSFIVKSTWYLKILCIYSKYEPVHYPIHKTCLKVVLVITEFLFQSEWEAEKEEKIRKLQEQYDASLDQIGAGHAQAVEHVSYSFSLFSIE